MADIMELDINVGHSVLLILTAAAVTFSLRAVPFVLFGGKREMPPVIKSVANLLPAAIIAVLVIYCLKTDIVNFGMGTAASAAGVVSVVLLHLWKRNVLISIFGGTVVYMMMLHLLPGLL